MRRYPTLLLGFLLVALTACQSERRENSRPNNSNLPGSSGGPLDVLVVCDASLWKGPAGQAFQKYYRPAQHGIMQPEPRYDVRQIKPLDLSSLLKRSRQIFILEVNPQGGTGINIDTNRWAQPQYVYKIQASDAESMARLIKERQEGMRRITRSLEVQVAQKRLLKKLRQKPLQILQEHNLHLQIPVGFEPSVNEKNVAVLWKKTNRYDMGLLVYSRPLSENLTLVGNEIIPLRDSLTRRHVPGQYDGSYMKTELLVPPQIKATELIGQFAFETRGLWKVEGDIMGGSFINYTIYDEAHQRLIFLDGFIYGPEVKKRNYLLELEAILKTIKLD